MEAKKQLRKPENWDDFENLCKKLWGEIWECKEIKKNGRKGQSQNGVDVYGIPNGEKLYYGIQCKGKDEYSHKLLSENEIDREIELAKSFKPPLAKFYFATTANKDSKIEEYIRIKDLENRQRYLFEVHLFSWDDIVDLIDENKQTHDWYLNLHKFKQKSEVMVCFEDDKDELTGTVKFYNQITYYQVGQEPTSFLEYTKYASPKIVDSPLFKGENQSYFRFRIKIKNIGHTPIENPQLIIQANGNLQEIGNENIPSNFTRVNNKSDIEFNETLRNLFINPHRNVFVPDEEYFSNIICIKPKYKGSDIELRWKLISNNFKKEGALKIKINTIFFQKEVNKFVEFRQFEKVERTIVDYFEDDE